LLLMTNRSNTKAWSGQFEVSSEVKSIVRIYKEVAKPDAKVLKLSEDKSLICVGWKYTLFLLRLHISQVGCPPPHVLMQRARTETRMVKF